MPSPHCNFPIVQWDRLCKVGTSWSPGGFQCSPKRNCVRKESSWGGVKIQSAPSTVVGWHHLVAGRGCGEWGGAEFSPGENLCRGKLRQSGIKIQLAPNNDTGWHHLVAGGCRVLPGGKLCKQGRTGQL